MISLVATIGGFLFGFDSGVINGTVDGLKKAFNSDSIGTGFNVASMLLGCAVGAFFAGTLADKIGRRTILVIAAVLFIISAWGSGIVNPAQCPAWQDPGRSLLGLRKEPWPGRGGARRARKGQAGSR